MLKRIFLRKSKEILQEVESAESTLKVAQEKMDELKKGDHFNLIRQELLRLINEGNYLHKSEGYNLHYGFNDIQRNYENKKELSIQINECLHELERMIKHE